MLLARNLATICLTALTLVHGGPSLAQTGNAPAAKPTVNDNAANSWVFVELEPVAPAPEGADESADTPPPLPVVGESHGYAFGGEQVSFTAAQWQAEIFSTSPLSAYTAEERAGRSDWEMPHRCGGTVISRRWILTAAHCVKAESIAAGRRVRLGARDISRDAGVTFRIDSVVRHPDYTGSFRRNDIALIRFSADRQSGPRAAAVIKPIAALDRGPELRPENPVVAMGWGKTRNVTNFQTSAVLLKVALKVVPQPECQARWVNQEVPKEIVLCAAAFAKATCSGDSGGPVIVNENNPVLVGVVAGGNKACNGDAKVPGIYTRVAAFSDWIDCVTRRGEARCNSRAVRRR